MAAGSGGSVVRAIRKRHHGGRVMKRATWAWAESREAETWTGFPSRAKAEAHGRRAYAQRMDGSPGFVAACLWPEPADVAMRLADADEWLERMDDYASEEFYSEDPLFLLRNKKAAHRALAKLIGAWAKRYVRATAFTVDSSKAEALIP